MNGSDVTYRLLIIDDERDLAESLGAMLREELSNLGKMEIEIEDSFDEAERRLASEQFDLIVLDVQLKSFAGNPVQKHRGRDLYDRIAKLRWVPVVFCTAWPDRVRDMETRPLITVVNKSHLPDSVDAVKNGLACEVVAVTRHLDELVDQEIRVFLRDVVAPNWEAMADTDHEEMVLVLVNRLAAWLKEHAVQDLDKRLGGTTGSSVDSASAARVYLFPPVTEHITATDLLVDEQSRWWLVLTPACDLYETTAEAVPRRIAKAQYVRIAKADPVADSPVVAAWLQGNVSKDKARTALRTYGNRFMYLPKYLGIPDLLVDFENVQSLPIGTVRGWQRQATLDSPFAEAALASFSHSAGRIGTPDISTDLIWKELEAEARRKRN